MDAATLYMIITLHDGSYRTGHIEVESMRECRAHVERLGARDVGKRLAWCRLSQNRRIVIAH